MNVKRKGNQRARKHKVSHFIQDLLDERGYTTIMDAARDLRLPYTTLASVSREGYENQILEFHIKAAKSFDIPLEAWLSGLLGEDRYSELI